MGEPFAGQRDEPVDQLAQRRIELVAVEARRLQLGCRHVEVADVLAGRSTSSPYAIGYGTFMPACQSRLMTSYSWPVQRSWSRCLP